MCGNYYKKQHQLGIMSAADYVIKQALWIFKRRWEKEAVTCVIVNVETIFLRCKRIR